MNRLQIQLGFVLILLALLTGFGMPFYTIAGAGTTGTALAETVVAFLLQSLSVAAIVGTALAVWGFRSAVAKLPLSDAAEPRPLLD